MKVYILSYLKNDKERIEVESSPSRERILNAKKRYEKIYNRKFYLSHRNIDIKMRGGEK